VIASNYIRPGGMAITRPTDRLAYDEHNLRFHSSVFEPLGAWNAMAILMRKLSWCCLRFKKFTTIKRYYP
jgi:hypothetical protein